MKIYGLNQENIIPRKPFILTNAYNCRPKDSLGWC